MMMPQSRRWPKILKKTPGNSNMPTGRELVDKGRNMGMELNLEPSINNQNTFP